MLRSLARRGRTGSACGGRAGTPHRRHPDGGGGGVQERCLYLVTALMTGVDCAASDIPYAMSGCSRRADWGMQSYRRCGRHYAMNGTDQDRTEFLHLSLPAEPTQL